MIRTLEEAFEQQKDENINDDTHLASFARMMVPSSIAKSLRVMYTPEMGDTLRVIKMVNGDGHTEYHLHNNYAMPGTSAPHDSVGPFLHAVKLIHNDAAKVIDSGGSVQLQTNDGSPHMETYRKIAKRLADKAGKQVIDVGNKPITTMPFMSGPVIIIK